MADTVIINNFRDLAARYKVLVCDIWGVIHNGQKAYDGVVDCLDRFRAHHGKVLLLSNAPRPHAPIRAQLKSLGVPEATYDFIVTSGDLTRKILKEKSQSSAFAIHHVGPDRDLPLFDGIDVRLVGLRDAQAIVCTGPFDDTKEGPDHYETYWAEAHARKLPFYCANPDLVVQRGDQLIYCAGALARQYASQGGEVVFLGKPHLPVYDFVAAHLVQNGVNFTRQDWLAIGDGLNTDIVGAARAGIDALLITGGIHAPELSDASGVPSIVQIRNVLAAKNTTAIAAMHRLVW